MGLLAQPAALPADAPRVLVVEDEILIRIVLADRLRDAGFEVVEALNGDEAVAILSAGAPIDLVLTDVRMPGATDGLDVLHFVQRTRPGIPVIVTSGDLEPRAAHVKGAARFLRKPYDLDLTVEAIHAALEGSL